MKACLAAALLFPAVAAIHGIVLAAVHVNGESFMLASSHSTEKKPRILGLFQAYIRISYSKGTPNLLKASLVKAASNVGL